MEMKYKLTIIVIISIGIFYKILQMNDYNGICKALSDIFMFLHLIDGNVNHYFVSTLLHYGFGVLILTNPKLIKFIF